VDNVRLESLHHAAEIQYQTRKVAPAELALSACPQDLLNILRDGAILHLSLVRFKLQIKDLVFRLRQRIQEPKIMGGVVSRKI
jgi:hypothetical protein